MNPRDDHSWTPDLRHGSGPIYLRIVEALSQARAAGILRPGERLPAQRELAQRLGVDLTTVSRAFAEARRRHLIDAAVGRGTFVTPHGIEEPMLDLAMNIPPSPPGVNLPALIRSGIDALLRRSSAEALLSYHPGPGSPAERAAAAQWLSGNGGERLPAVRVGVGAGAQAILAAVLLARSRAGDAIAVDALTYPGMIALAASMGRRLVSVASDGDGMMPDRLEEAARGHGARLVYLNPTLQNPTTLVMPQARRLDVAAVARRCGLTMIEDDPYSRLMPDPPVPFASIAPEVTIRIATLSKCVSPFLRTAFFVTPDEHLLDEVAMHLRSVTLMAPPLMSGLAAEWVRSGRAGEIAAAVGDEASARQDIAASILPQGYRSHPRGFHLWMPLDAGSTAADIVARARRRALVVGAASDFSTAPHAPEAIRVALGAVAGRKALEQALQGLAEILAGSDRRSPALV